jgi:MOSC domain-containing protein YiiM
MCRVGTGLDGDRHAKSGRGKRQVTLIQAEHLPVMSGLTGQTVRPEMLRRNIVVSGLNLVALKRSHFRIGEALLKGSGPCAPCSRMEENLGPGGYQAMRGHGGITAIVIAEGAIRIGDAVTGVSLDEPTDG